MELIAGEVYTAVDKMLSQHGLADAWYYDKYDGRLNKRLLRASLKSKTSSRYFEVRVHTNAGKTNDELMVNQQDVDTLLRMRKEVE